MPCSGPDLDTNVSLSYRIKELKDERDLVTRHLCEVLGSLDAQGIEWQSNLSPSISTWWYHHKELDEKRAKEEIKQAKLKKLETEYKLQRLSIEKE